jgi:hypothetical protein
MPRFGTGKRYYLLTEKFKTYGINMGRDALFHFLQREYFITKKKNYTKKTMKDD